MKRDFIFSFFSQFVVSLVICILIPAIPIYLLRFGAKEGEIGFLIGIFSVSSLILRPFVGKALLTISERDFMIAGSVREFIPSEQKSLHARSFLSWGALPPAIMAFMLNVTWGSIAAFSPLYSLEHGVSNPMIFFIFLAATLILGRGLGGKILDVSDRKKVVSFCLSIVTIALIILPLAKSLRTFILFAVMLGTGWASLYPFFTIHVIENAGLERGPVMGTLTALADLGSGLGPMLMGLVLEKYNYPVMFGCLVLTGGLNFLYFYGAIAKKNDRSQKNQKEIS